MDKKGYSAIRLNVIGEVTEFRTFEALEDAREWAKANTLGASSCIIYQAIEKTRLESVVKFDKK